MISFRKSIVFSVVFMALIFASSCSDQIQNYQTGNVIVGVPYTSSVNEVAFNDILLGIYPLSVSFYKVNSLQTRVLKTGQVEFIDLVPGTYAVAIYNLSDSYYNRTYKLVQVVGGETKRYNLF